MPLLAVARLVRTIVSAVVRANASQQLVYPGQYRSTVGTVVLGVHPAPQPGQIGACPTLSGRSVNHGHRHGRIIGHCGDGT